MCREKDAVITVVAECPEGSALNRAIFDELYPQLYHWPFLEVRCGERYGVRALYALYGECFPLLSPLQGNGSSPCWLWSRGKSSPGGKAGRWPGAAVLHGDSLPLLCVGERFRGRGLGSQLLAQAEERAKSQGHFQVVLGQGPHYLFQGVPEENPGALEFFQKRGYQAAWFSVNMRLDLAGYDPGQVDIPPVPEGVAFRLLETGEEPCFAGGGGGRPARLAGVLPGVPLPILVAVEQGQLVGFAMVPPEGGRFLGDVEKPGSLECVGVVKSHRNRGIGMGMVLAGIRWLKEQGCGSIELRYVALEDWYEKVGFCTFSADVDGRKKTCK